MVAERRTSWRLSLQSPAPGHAGSLSQARSARGVQGRPKLRPACLPGEGFLLHSAPAPSLRPHSSRPRTRAQARSAPLGVLSVHMARLRCRPGWCPEAPKRPCVVASHVSRADGGAQRLSGSEPVWAPAGSPGRVSVTSPPARLRSFPEAVPRAQGRGSSAEASARAPLQLRGAG